MEKQPDDVVLITLDLYHEASVEARDAEFFVRAKERKPWLTREIIECYGIGNAPTLKQCKALWLARGQDEACCERTLRSVGLLCDPLDGRGAPYMFFRDCMVIPWFDACEPPQPLYFTSRRLKDFDLNGQPLAKDKKALSMRSPDEQGRGGVQKPAAWGLNVLMRGDRLEDVLVVESPLEAIYCWSVLGQPAIALAGSSTDRLAQWVKQRNAA